MPDMFNRRHQSFHIPMRMFILCQHCAGPEQLLRYLQCPHCRTAVHGSFKAGYNTYRSEHITSIIPEKKEIFIMEDSSTKKEDQLQDSNGDNILQDSEQIFLDDDNSSSESMNDNYERKFFNEYTNMQISPPFRNKQLPFRSHPLGAMKKMFWMLLTKELILHSTSL